MNNYEKVSTLIFRFLGFFIAFPAAVAFLFIAIGLLFSPPYNKADLILVGNIQLLFVSLGMGLMILSKSLAKLICRRLD